jgi:hypothetical protein
MITVVESLIVARINFESTHERTSRASLFLFHVEVVEEIMDSTSLTKTVSATTIVDEVDEGHRSVAPWPSTVP